MPHYLFVLPQNGASRGQVIIIIIIIIIITLYCITLSPEQQGQLALENAGAARFIKNAHCFTSF